MIPKYTINLLGSVSRWLRAKSNTVWAKAFGHQTTMVQYADSLDQVVAYFKTQHAQCPRCGGTDGPLLREAEALDCDLCVTRTYVVDFAHGCNQELVLTHRHCLIQVKWPARSGSMFLNLALRTKDVPSFVMFDSSFPVNVNLGPNTLNAAILKNFGTCYEVQQVIKDFK
jgi:hypothetical protein